MDYRVSDLPYTDYCVDPSTPGKEVWTRMQEDAEISGVIVVREDQLVGMISRRRFLERMSRPYSLEIYLKRPIEAILEVENVPVLEVPADARIDEVVTAALNRPLELVYEPVVVISPDQLPRLIDLHVLLLAQSQMLAASNAIIQQKTAELQSSLDRLTEEQNKVREYTRLLEIKQMESKQRNDLLQAQQAELTRKTREIEEFNKRFVRIGQLLSLEGKKAFQATFTGVNSICNTTEQIISAGQALEKELEAVDNATKIIEDVSKQVRHLAVQAAVIANQSGGQFAGFGYITSEIGKLVSQTFEASSQVNRIASRFRSKIQENNAAARSTAETARSLIQKVQRAEAALAELEQVVGAAIDPTSSAEAVQAVIRSDNSPEAATRLQLVADEATALQPESVDDV
ncbi:MAG: CBS domain-containing protein [Gloeomargarita sp. SKYG116]|nr:CBS domain-containing protein [Gloeomargarita sp. SKYG116]MCS7226934.1 CBS domain-containing protein [Gloeomargarita sp. SKYB31]MDW8401866.1 CBS domain-containing protein [Gloeomargarita sp. SKYGB_i_bin116]